MNRKTRPSGHSQRKGITIAAFTAQEHQLPPFAPTISYWDHNAIVNKQNRPRVSDDKRLAGTSGACAELAARSPSPSQRHQHPASWVSPGKAAANAATAAAKEAARAAAASVRAAEAAADAAEAAEAAAEAEEELCSRSPAGGGVLSPPAISECREHHSPARSAFYLTDGDKGGTSEHLKSESPHPNGDASSNRHDGHGGRENGDGRFPSDTLERRALNDGGGGDVGNYRSPAASGPRSNEEEMLRKARDQVSCVRRLKPETKMVKGLR